MIKQSRLNKLRKVTILSATFLLTLSACKKDEEKISPKFAQDISKADFTNQIKLSTKTIKSDSILADKIATGLAGVYKDSAFGTSKASIFVQPLLPSNYLTLGEVGETMITDSIVLSLIYDGGFGDSTSQTFEVFRITEEMDRNKSYPSNSNISTSTAILGTKTFRPQFNKKLKILNPNITGGVDTITVDPQLRIRLDNALGDEILSKSGQSELANNNNFKAFFNGLKISPKVNPNIADNEDAILYFALTSSATRVNLFYSVINSNNDTTRRVVYFPINSTSVRFNTFEHDYTATAVEASLNSTEDDSIYTYVQAMAGVQTLIKFPDLKERFNNKKMVINKAELILPIAGGSYSKFGVANSLILASKNESGELTFIPDFFEGESYFGGQYDSDKKEYKFNISRYIQDVIDDKTISDGLIVLTTGGAVKASRVVLLGSANPNKKIKLNLYYSNTE